MAAAPWSGTATADFQKPSNAAPPSSQPGDVALCNPASSHANPRYSRIGSQTSPAREFDSRNRANAGPSTSTWSESGSWRASRYSSTTSAIAATQKAADTMSLSPSGTVTQGLTNQNSSRAASTPTTVAADRR